MRTKNRFGRNLKIDFVDHEAPASLGRDFDFEGVEQCALNLFGPALYL